MKHLIIAALVLLLQGCVSQSGVVKNSSSIKSGMSPEQLRQVMGEPQNRQFRGKNEAWQYCATDYTGFEGADQYILVWLSDGVVSGMQSYRNTLHGTCESFFRTVKWDEAPDRTIEIRQR